MRGNEREKLAAALDRRFSREIERLNGVIAMAEVSFARGGITASELSRVKHAAETDKRAILAALRGMTGGTLS